MALGSPPVVSGPAAALPSSTQWPDPGGFTALLQPRGAHWLARALPLPCHRMSFDTLPLWTILLGTLSIVVLALQYGALIGGRRRRDPQEKPEVPTAIVGATMGLLAFMLAFTFNSAAGRHEARKALVIKEANAIETTWLRAGFLPEPARTTMRGLLRSYVGVRVRVATDSVDLSDGLRQSEELQERMWAVAEETGRTQ